MSLAQSGRRTDSSSMRRASPTALTASSMGMEVNNARTSRLQGYGYSLITSLGRSAIAVISCAELSRCAGTVARADFSLQFRRKEILSEGLRLLLRQKRRVPSVYQVTCNSCSRSYIGHTSRDLHVRIRDHMLGRGSTIHQHITTCSRNKISVSILSREKDPTNAAIAEGLYIRQKKPELNLRDEGVNLV